MSPPIKKNSEAQPVRPSTVTQIKSDLQALADSQRAANLAWFFKTGKGEYAENDRFLGITVPVQRQAASRHKNLPLTGIAKLLQSRFHEHRFVALTILVKRFQAAAPLEQDQLVDFYLTHAKGINNWDLVDTSAPYILGEYLKSHTSRRSLLDKLAHSTNLWERRIAMVATLALIKSGEIGDTFRIARLLLSDKHDLIHKAVGWALREAGIVSRPALLQFLKQHYEQIPRTTLRYAIEHLSADARKQALSGIFAAD